MQTWNLGLMRFRFNHTQPPLVSHARLILLWVGANRSRRRYRTNPTTVRTHNQYLTVAARQTAAR